MRRANSPDEEAIVEVLESVERAHQTKDPGAIVEAFAPDAVLYSLAPPLANRGLDRTELEDWLDTWEGGVRLTSAERAITVDGALAVVRCLTRMEGRNRAQADDADIWYRSTIVLEKDAGRWRITHQHDSVPFYMDGSLGAAVNLKPTSV
jgi:ketosteroid isomerase-like protein